MNGVTILVIKIMTIRLFSYKALLVINRALSGTQCQAINYRHDRGDDRSDTFGFNLIQSPATRCQAALPMLCSRNRKTPQMLCFYGNSALLDRMFKLPA